ncbi:hypothetical protein [Streptomyces sp. NPDC007083]|uniref:hypothetical protein n=1 Tax=unclassified Streptomyces TaxID=2593676 RepID=UPI0033F6C36E
MPAESAARQAGPTAASALGAAEPEAPEADRRAICRLSARRLRGPRGRDCANAVVAGEHPCFGRLSPKVARARRARVRRHGEELPEIADRERRRTRGPSGGLGRQRTDAAGGPV